MLRKNCERVSHICAPAAESDPFSLLHRADWDPPATGGHRAVVGGGTANVRRLASKRCASWLASYLCLRRPVGYAEVYVRAGCMPRRCRVSAMFLSVD